MRTPEPVREGSGDPTRQGGRNPAVRLLTVVLTPFVAAGLGLRWLLQALADGLAAIPGVLARGLSAVVRIAGRARVRVGAVVAAGMRVLVDVARSIGGGPRRRRQGCLVRGRPGPRARRRPRPRGSPRGGGIHGPVVRRPRHGGPWVRVV